MPAVDESRGSKSVEVRRVWEIYDDRPQFMSQQDSILLSESLDVGDVSLFLVALPLVRVWFLGVGWLVSAVFGLAVIRFGRFVVMLLMFMMLLISSCIVTLLSLLRLTRGVCSEQLYDSWWSLSLARSVELTAQWDRIPAVGHLYPVTLDDLHAVQGLGLGDFHRIVSGVHRRLSDFVHAVVVHRRDEAIRGGGIGFGKIPWFILTRG